MSVKHLLVFCRSCFYTGTLETFLSVEHSVFDCRRHILPSCMVAGKSKPDIHWMKDLFYKIFVLNNSVFCTFSFFAEDCKL